MEIKFEGVMITGASDDLIEISGEISDEFECYDCTNGKIACSDGTLIDVTYGDYGIWRFTILSKGTLFDRKEEGSVDKDENDKIYFNPGLKWITFHEDACVANK